MVAGASGDPERGLGARSVSRDPEARTNGGSPRASLRRGVRFRDDLARYTTTYGSAREIRCAAWIMHFDRPWAMPLPKPGQLRRAGKRPSVSLE